MLVITQTPTRLVITHRVPPQMIRNTTLCMAFILLTPAFFQFFDRDPGVFVAPISVLLLAAFAGCLAFAYRVAGTFETYTIDAEQQVYELVRSNRNGSTRELIRFAQVRDIFQERIPDSDYPDKEYVVLVLDPGDRRVRLPMKYTFTGREREEFGSLLGLLLGRRLRLIEKSSGLFGKTKVHY